MKTDHSARRSIARRSESHPPPNTNPTQAICAAKLVHQGKRTFTRWKERCGSSVFSDGGRRSIIGQI
uniref:Uncharacterized protein n=1 Tax=Arundo donax TaxID=35708 RepID=A0A0A9H1R7_ARUDO